MQNLITAFIFVLAGGLISFLEKIKNNKKDKKTNRYNYLGFMLIIVGSIFGLRNGYLSKINKDVADKKMDPVNTSH